MSVVSRSSAQKEETAKAPRSPRREYRKKTDEVTGEDPAPLLFLFVFFANFAPLRFIRFACGQAR
jgi:hypothetical protein